MSELKWIEEPVMVETVEVPIAKLYAKVPVSEIQTQMGLLVRELSEVLIAQEIKPVGAWFTHHFRRPEEFFDFEVCFEVERPIVASGRVEPGVWPAMKVVRTYYEGPYSGLVAAWGEFMAWLAAHSVEVTPEIYERYGVNPENEADPAKWRTELTRCLV